MWKWVLFIPGTIFFLMGLVDWAAGALVPHGYYLLRSGAILMIPATPNVVTAGVKYFRQKYVQLKTIKGNS